MNPTFTTQVRLTKLQSVVKEQHERLCRDLGRNPTMDELIRAVQSTTLCKPNAVKTARGILANLGLRLEITPKERRSGDRGPGSRLKRRLPWEPAAKYVRRWGVLARAYWEFVTVYKRLPSREDWYAIYLRGDPSPRGGRCSEVQAHRIAQNLFCMGLISDGLSEAKLCLARLASLEKSKGTKTE